MSRHHVFSSTLLTSFSTSCPRRALLFSPSREERVHTAYDYFFSEPPRAGQLRLWTISLRAASPMPSASPGRGHRRRFAARASALARARHGAEQLPEHALALLACNARRGARAAQFPPASGYLPSSRIGGHGGRHHPAVPDSREPSRRSAHGRDAALRGRAVCEPTPSPPAAAMLALSPAPGPARRSVPHLSPRAPPSLPRRRLPHRAPTPHPLARDAGRPAPWRPHGSPPSCRSPLLGFYVVFLGPSDGRTVYSATSSPADAASASPNVPHLSLACRRAAPVTHAQNYKPRP